MPADDKYADAPPSQWISELLLQIENMILIAIACLIFLQCLAHALFFSAALLIPFMSRMSQPNIEYLDSSQLVLQLAIPTMAAIPMILTILSRQRRLQECWNYDSDKDVESYLKQRLWPLDKNWSSKIGILLAFTLISIVFGINLKDLL